MNATPSRNNLAFVAVSDEGRYRAPVADARAAAARLGGQDVEDEPDVDAPQVGSEVAVFWLGKRTRYLMPVRMVGVSRQRPAAERPEGSEQAEPSEPAEGSELAEGFEQPGQFGSAGEPRRQTRRRFVRGSGGAPVQLGNATSSPLDGVLSDISEGGVRCRVRNGDFAPGDPVNLSITLGDEIVDIVGTVQTVRPDPDGDLQVVITYQLPEATARAVRQYVFASEVSERRQSRYGD